MSIGKRLRLAAWMKNGRTFLIALDEVIPRGLDHAPNDLEQLLPVFTSGKADGMVLHAGLAARFEHLLVGKCPWIMKLTSNSAFVENRTIRGPIGTVEQALSMGASGVAVNVFIGSPYEKDHLSFLSQCVEKGNLWGMPVIAFVNPPIEHETNPKMLAYACRIGAEIGADVVKTNYSGDSTSFLDVVTKAIVPVLVEDSPLPETREGTLATVDGAITAGGAGVLLGKRVWGASDGPGLAREIKRIILR
jgi:DhnA family fructose-bisphosphate aldolase class Ia